jgi:hypothetical protein
MLCHAMLLQKGDSTAQHSTVGCCTIRVSLPHSYTYAYNIGTSARLWQQNLVRPLTSHCDYLKKILWNRRLLSLRHSTLTASIRQQQLRTHNPVRNVRVQLDVADAVVSPFATSASVLFIGRQRRDVGALSEPSQTGYSSLTRALNQASRSPIGFSACSFLCAAHHNGRQQPPHL